MSTESRLGSRAAAAINLRRLLTRLKLLGAARQLRLMTHSFRNCLLATFYPSGKFVKCNGAEVFVSFNDPNFCWYYGSNRFLDQEHEAFVRLLQLRSPAVIIDIGAHWGIFPAMLDADERVCKKIKQVICIEPDPRNIPLLKATVSRIRNFLVVIVEAAIGDSAATIPAYRDGGSCLQTYGTPEQKSDLFVNVRTLTTILSEQCVALDEISHIKIDIDGYEPNFFFGNIGLLKRAKPLLMSEYWANGLYQNSSYEVADYWKLLQANYIVILADYPGGGYVLLEETDLNLINEMTTNSVRNVLLIPRGADISPRFWE